MKLATQFIVISSLVAFLAGCAGVDTRSARPTSTVSKKGGYYKDDGPGDNPPADLAAIPDAVPRSEPLHRGASKPYTALGRDYVPMTDARGFREQGMASWYGRRYHGRPTSSGEPYDMYAMTAAHPTLPIPSYVRVSNPANGRSVVVRVNDRGPFHAGRIIDLSYTAAWKLDILKGVTPVEVVAIDPAAPSIPPATVVTTPLPAVAPAPAAGSALYLQLAAFGNPEGALQFAERVQMRLGEALPGVQRLESGPLIKVQAGPFADLAQADQAAQAIEREFGLRPFRVTR
jgi:rare lipoprotein A